MTKDKASTGFTVIIVEEVAEALAGEGREITGDRGGVFIETNILAHDGSRAGDYFMKNWLNGQLWRCRAGEYLQPSGC